MDKRVAGGCVPLGVSGCVVVVVVIGAIALPAAAITEGCVAPPGAKLVRATTDAVITVERHVDGDPLDGGSESQIWRGCSEHAGDQLVLEQGTSAFGGGRIAKNFNLAGEIVGYLAVDLTKHETTAPLTVVSLATGSRWSR